MMTPEPLTAAAFAPFGDVIDVTGPPDQIINAGLCGRHHDLARLDFGPSGRAGLSLFDAKARQLPLTIDMMERHPLASQAFLPLNGVPLLLVVAPDANGIPGAPRAYISSPPQGVNLLRNTWHYVCAPLGARGLYAVIDRIADDTDPASNLQEHFFTTPHVVHPAAG